MGCGHVLSAGWSEQLEFSKEGQGLGHRTATCVGKARAWHSSGTGGASQGKPGRPESDSLMPTNTEGP